MSKAIWVTGMAGMCPAGKSWEEVRDVLQAGHSCYQAMPEWSGVEGLKPKLGGLVPDFKKPDNYPRKKVRSMGRVALMATRTTELALETALLNDSEIITSGQTGIAYGSTIGAEPAIRKFAERIGFNNTLTGITGATFIQLMSHTCAANLAQFFSIKGRVLPTNAGDVSGSQGIGYGFETLASGQQSVMITGGSEALSMVGASLFDMLGTTSKVADPSLAVHGPFDSQRDGTVVAEGAASLILERGDHAQKRNAPAFGQLCGYASVCDKPRQLHPNREKIAGVIRKAIRSANLNPEDIGWVHAHGLAHQTADIEESHAIAQVFGSNMPVTCLKSYFGHTQAASAAVECWLALNLLNEGWVPPILNRTQPDPNCAELAYLEKIQEIPANYALLLTYSYSGVITALVIGSAESIQ